MNFLAHGWRSVPSGDAWLVAGTALPDWLRVLRRRLRASPDAARAALGGADAACSSLARGVLRHVDDDRRFHQSDAFAASTGEIAALVRPLRDAESAFRPSFAAHLLVEMLVDAELARESPERLAAYYSRIASLDGAALEAAAAPLATGPVDGLGALVRSFTDARFAADYADDARLARRLDQVFRRARQPVVAAAIVPCLPAARGVVRRHAAALLANAEG